MRSVRLSFVIYTLLALGMLGGSCVFLTQEKALYIVLSVVFVLYALGVAVWFIWPVGRLGGEVRKLFAGKSFRMLRALRKDEVGDMIHFFNRITRSIEEVIGAVEQGKRLGSEVEVGKEIQENVLPKSVSSVPYLDIMVKTKPAAEMGGDSFDFISYEKETFFYIGDATGHGIPAGLIMMMINILMHALCKAGSCPKDILVEMNRILRPKMLKTRFMTVTLLHWDHERRVLQFAGAGHERLYFYRKETGMVDMVPSGGIALGMIADITAITKVQEVPFAEGDMLLLYSDGVTEATDEVGNRYTDERLQQQFQVAASQSGDVDVVFRSISRDYGGFVKGVPQQDDVTLMIIGHIADPEGSQHISLAGGEEERSDFWS